MDSEKCVFDHSYYTPECDYYATTCGYTVGEPKNSEPFDFCPYCGKPRGY